MEEKQTYQDEAGRTVTVWNKHRTILRGQRCYRIEGRGDLGLFTGEGTPGAAIVLHAEAQDNGTWSLWYKPNYPEFDDYARELAEVGEW